MAPIRSKLMELSYSDPKFQIRLTGYAIPLSSTAVRSRRSAPFASAVIPKSCGLYRTPYTAARRWS